MALQETTVTDKIEVLENGSVQVREALRVLKNNETIAQTYHRFVVAPGDDYSNLDPKVQAICAVVHTPEVIAAYQAQLAAQQTTLGVVNE
jgi:hypothetical protein